MPRIKDLREYLRVLESLNDVEHVDRPVSAVLEAAAITRRSTEQRRPAPLFEQIVEAKPGFRLLGAAGALSSHRANRFARIALSLGLPHDATARQLVEHVAQACAQRPEDVRDVCRIDIVVEHIGNRAHSPDPAGTHDIANAMHELACLDSRQLISPILRDGDDRPATGCLDQHPCSRDRLAPANASPSSDVRSLSAGDPYARDRGRIEFEVKTSR